ncbi:beta-N-acetylhexosaminidase [Chromatiaceae bacterium AAb-1]|nr:beta-N-acetylhexosaminidase [Chromatiaceae bacterium AAb-1]
MSKLSAATEIPALEQMIAQKLMLDIRYYCAEPVAAGTCRTPLTVLPPELAELISKYDIGGVILFAENLQDIPQTVTLNHQLQQAAAQSALKQPLFIGIDQEGGRVARLPRHLATSFSGNMAIGATYATHGTRFAAASGEILAKELLAVGINLNFAPTVDVNVNAQNPVINVRSFGEDPQRVAELGGAQLHAMQQQGMIAALKHFPGHGDTHIDSHLGLPRVDHSVEDINRVDLYPFAEIIKQQMPGMIMTAHIQYPQLDSSTFVAKNGDTMIKPATMSKAIMQGVLRGQLEYQGVIITDALDMAGISHFFTPVEAVINTFAAGVDIALMPLKIQTPAELEQLPQMISAIARAVQQEQLAEQEIAASYQRIIQLKKQFKLSAPATSLAEQIKKAQQIVGQPAHRKTELELARAAITLVKQQASQWPLKLTAKTKVVLVMPDSSKAEALSHSLQQVAGHALNIRTVSLQQLTLSAAEQQLATADIVISGFISPMQTLAEIGGMDDLGAVNNLAQAYQQQRQQFGQLLQFIDKRHVPHVFISLRAPYEITGYAPYADTVMASYAYNVDTDPLTGQVSGPVYQALAEALVGKLQPEGQLPVTVEKEQP